MLLSSSECDLVQERCAAWLINKGLRSSDRFVLEGSSSPETYHLITGALRVGIIPVVVNPGLLSHEREIIVTDADTPFELSQHEVFTSCEFARSTPIARFPLARPMLYTSGTTGRPKGVWTGVMSEADAMALWTDEIVQWQLTSADRCVQIGPLYHSAPYRFAVCTQLAGGHVAFPGPFDANRTSTMIEEVRATFGFAAPVHLQRMLRLNPTRLSSFRLLAHAGAPCPVALKNEAIAAIGRDGVWEFYGSTEGQFTVCSPKDFEQAPSSVGRARAHRRLSVDDDGVIWCEAPPWSRFTYWRDPERTAAAWSEDRFTVGDLGRLDGDYLYLEGRRGDLIISGGVNVYPLEVERSLLESAVIDDVAVFAVDDAEWGQAVCAAVVTEADEARLRSEAAARLAPYKRPKRWVVVESIPTSSTGKVRRERLAEDLGVSAR